MKRTVLFTILMIFCLSITACATDPNHLTDAQTSIFHSLNVTHTDNSIVVKADAYLNITDADFLIIDVSEEDTVSLTYTLTRNKGDITLSYRTPDDSTVLLADTEDKTYGRRQSLYSRDHHIFPCGHGRCLSSVLLGQGYRYLKG